MDLGYFRDFGWNPSVLASGTRSEIDELRLIIAGFLASADTLLSIHELPFVRSYAGTKLYLLRDDVPEIDGFRWVCGSGDVEGIDESLRALVFANGPGHQYFDLYPEGNDLIVSFSEYGAHLWADAESPHLPVQGVE